MYVCIYGQAGGWMASLASFFPLLNSVYELCQSQVYVECWEEKFENLLAIRL